MLAKRLTDAYTSLGFKAVVSQLRPEEASFVKYKVYCDSKGRYVPLKDLGASLHKLSWTTKRMASPWTGKSQELYASKLLCFLM